MEHHAADELNVEVALPERSLGGLAHRREAYEADITYGTNNEFGFDYLRDNMAMHVEERFQRGLHYAIVDEVDSILIDEARTPLIISGPAEQSARWYKEFSGIVAVRVLPSPVRISAMSPSCSTSPPKIWTG